MSRAYPRFLFSNPQNTKSQGPFIVHTLEPRLVFKLEKVFDNNPSLIFLDKIMEPTNEHQQIWEAAMKWCHNNDEVKEWVTSQKSDLHTFRKIMLGPINPEVFNK